MYAWEKIICILMHFNALKFKCLIKIHFIPNRVFPTGVEGICLGEATAVIAMLGERRRSQPVEYFIDGVLDTIGGLLYLSGSVNHWQ